MQGRFLRLIIVLVAIGGHSHAQQTKIYLDPQAQYKQAKELYQNGQYSLAYPLFKELRESLRTTDLSNNRVEFEDINYYAIACGLQQNEGFAATDAKQYIDLSHNLALNQKLSFELAEYYFRKNDLTKSLDYYEKTSVGNLDNRQIADMKFHQGYIYFTKQQFDKARPLLQSISQSPSDPNYQDANYYYGFIAYYDHKYKEALDAFQIVENHPTYGKIVPFYITNIYYFQGQKDKALEYGEAALKKGGGYYDLPMQKLIGHAWFERKNYIKALSYLEAYNSGSDKVSREDIYELSYCYYQANQLSKAVEGFKKLSDGGDSLSQSAMYILGDAYLKLGQKSNARSAFSFCAANNNNALQREVSKFNYAKLSYELGFQDVALSEFKKFIQEYPNSEYNKEAVETLVNMMAKTNNYREALSMLDAVESPSDQVKKLYPRILYGRAMELINDQDLEGAKTLLDKGLKDPNNASLIPAINFWEGEIAYRQNRLDDAIRFYNAYLSNPSYLSGEVTPANAKYNLGYCYFRKENYRQALGFFEQVSRSAALNSTPVEQDVYLRSADCYFMNRDFSRAKSMYNTVVNYSWPSSDYATFQTAMIAGVGNPNEKINLLKSIVRRYPSSSLMPDADLEIAKTYLADEKFREAIPYLNNVINAPGANNLKPESYLKLGLSYFNLNKNEESLNQYRKLVSQYPNSTEAEEAIDNMKAIYVQEGKAGDFVDFMKSTGRTVTVSEEENLMYKSAENKYIDKDYNAAITAFNNYLMKFPDGQNATSAWFLRSEIYNLRKDWKNAVSGYAEVTDRGPGKYAERSAAQAGRIYYFELNDYPKAEEYFKKLKDLATAGDNRLDAMRGLLRSQYQLKEWTEAVPNAQDLLKEKNISVDDKVLANMVIARSQQSKQQYAEAIQSFRNVVGINKSAFAAEARYEIANSYFAQNDLKNAEKTALETVNKSGSYDYWITKAYILLGEVFAAQKDFFNAKATLQSVIENSKITELKNEAQDKLNQVMEAEKK
jgi:TolA-binding protein